MLCKKMPPCNFGTSYPDLITLKDIPLSPNNQTGSIFEMKESGSFWNKIVFRCWCISEKLIKENCVLQELEVSLQSIKV